MAPWAVWRCLDAARGESRSRFQRVDKSEVCGRILSFDAAASVAYARLRARACAQGKVIAPPDGYVAATAKTHGLIVATRDTGPFEAAGLTVINPWNTRH
jgi:predicted nucleic acid-binding protein